MTDDDRPVKTSRYPILTSELSPEANFALARIQAIAGGEKSDAAVAFQAAFIKVFRQPFWTAPRSLWYAKFEKGLHELAQLGIVEVVRDGMGGWSVTRFHEDRVAASMVKIN